MGRLRSNIATNLIAALWTTILTAAITPVQVNLLGIEAYGIIGFVATLQIVFAAFDLGLSSTLTREIASDISDDRRRTAQLIRTASTVYWLLAFVIGLTLAAFAGSIARGWFNPQDLTSLELEHALYLIIAYLALRWPTALYIGILAGLQRMPITNYIKIAAVSLRLVGGIAVILVWRDIHAFLSWTVLTALLEVAAYSLAARRALPVGSPGTELEFAL